MSQPTNSEEIDENKIDFNLLNLRQRTHSNESSDSTILSDSTLATDEIWPLHLTPKFIDHYIIGDLIGSGSYAEVRECVDTRNLERCALKIINKEYLRRQAPGALGNQMQEIGILKHFKHTNIIRMHECLHKGSFIYIALEFCAFNLNELLNDQPTKRFSLFIARRLFHQLCFGLDYLHSLGIVHRDIKPDNLLLTNSGTLKIIDFGVSHILSMWTRDDWCSNYEGTPLFQAPEVISGQIEYHGFKVDIWSCGITLFLMLFGTYPFMDDALLGLYDKILSQDLEVPKGEPTTAALRDLLAIMLEKDHQKRASIDQVLEHPCLKLCHANLYDGDEVENSEFFDFVTAQNHFRKSPSRDVYRSMTVLPYLYRHHFPNKPIRKSKRSCGSLGARTSTGQRIEQLNPISSTSASDNSSSERSSNLTDETVSSRTDAPSGVAGSSSSNQTDSSDSFLDSDETNQIEWGTEEQYQLMRIPRVRANRVRALSSRLRRRRRGAAIADQQENRPTSG